MKGSNEINSNYEIRKERTKDEWDNENSEKEKRN